MVCACFIWNVNKRRYQRFFAVSVLSVLCAWFMLEDDTIKIYNKLYSFTGESFIPFLQKILPRPDHIQGENHPGHLSHPPRPPPVGPRGRRRGRRGPGAGLLNPVCILCISISISNKNNNWETFSVVQKRIFFL